jgi:hypothetical protein
MEISPEKYETRAFLEHDPPRCYIIVDNICEEFKYFSCEISYENEIAFNKYYQNFLNYWEFLIQKS